MAVEDKYADEVMSDEELDNVAGGTMEEVVEDHKFLYEHGLVDNYRSLESSLVLFRNTTEMIKEGWAKAGITCNVTWDYIKIKQYNSYTDSSGRPISRDEAFNIVKEHFSKN